MLPKQIEAHLKRLKDALKECLLGISEVHESAWAASSTVAIPHYSRLMGTICQELLTDSSASLPSTLISLSGMIVKESEKLRTSVLLGEAELHVSRLRASIYCYVKRAGINKVKPCTCFY